MRITFVGGTRFIGHVTAELAVRRGHDVTLLHRGAHPADVASARENLVDRGDAVALRTALCEARPDVVIDTRAMDRSEAEACASACASLDVPVVVISSQDVYAQFGSLNGHPAPRIDVEVDEDAPLTVPYPFRDLCEHEGGPNYDKKDVEAAYQAALTSTTILRLPAVYGRRDYKRRFGSLIDAFDAARARGEARCSFPCRGGASFRWTHAHVDDVAQAVVAVAERPSRAPRIYNVGERDVPTMRERAEAMGRFAGIEVTWQETNEPIEGPFGMFDLHPNDFVASTTAMRRELGFAEERTDDERLADLFTWLRATRAL